MPSYSNRGHQEDPSYGSGGYGRDQGYDPNYASIPRAPRAPHFPQMVAAAPAPVATGRGFNQTGPFPQSPASNRIPGAPNSLSPVAMASARNAVATGPFQAQDTQEVKARPSSKAGMSILFAGAIIGGLIGAVMHARETTADAFAQAAQQAHDAHDKFERADSTPAASGSGLPPIMVPALNGANGAGAVLPADKAAADKLLADKTVDKGADKTKSGKKIVVAFGGGTKHAASGGVDKSAEKALESDKPEPTPASSKKGKKSKDDDGYTVASNGEDKSEPTAKPEPKAEKTADKGATKKADKAEKTADKSDAKPVKKQASGDAVDVLKAAMGATENTL